MHGDYGPSEERAGANRRRASDTTSAERSCSRAEEDKKRSGSLIKNEEENVDEKGGRRKTKTKKRSELVFFCFPKHISQRLYFYEETAGSPQKSRTVLYTVRLLCTVRTAV